LILISDSLVKGNIFIPLQNATAQHTHTHTVFYTADLSDYSNSPNIVTCAVIVQYSSNSYCGQRHREIWNVWNITPNTKSYIP